MIKLNFFIRIFFLHKKDYIKFTWQINVQRFEIFLINSLKLIIKKFYKKRHLKFTKKSNLQI